MPGSLKTACDIAFINLGSTTAAPPEPLGNGFKANPPGAPPKQKGPKLQGTLPKKNDI